MIMVVDHSVSIDKVGPNTFYHKVRPFLVKVAEALNVGPGAQKSHLAMVSFSEWRKTYYSYGKGKIKFSHLLHTFTFYKCVSFC